jgi:hypothetical protein
LAPGDRLRFAKPATHPVHRSGRPSQKACPAKRPTATPQPLREPHAVAGPDSISLRVVRLTRDGSEEPPRRGPKPTSCGLGPTLLNSVSRNPCFGIVPPLCPSSSEFWVAIESNPPSLHGRAGSTRTSPRYGLRVDRPRLRDPPFPCPSRRLGDVATVVGTGRRPRAERMWTYRSWLVGGARSLAAPTLCGPLGDRHLCRGDHLAHDPCVLADLAAAGEAVLGEELDGCAE